MSNKQLPSYNEVRSFSSGERNIDVLIDVDTIKTEADSETTAEVTAAGVDNIVVPCVLPTADQATTPDIPKFLLLLQTIVMFPP